MTLGNCIVCGHSCWRRMTRKWIRVKWLSASLTTCRLVNLLARYSSVEWSLI